MAIGTTLPITTTTLSLAQSPLIREKGHAVQTTKLKFILHFVIAFHNVSNI